MNAVPSPTDPPTADERRARELATLTQLARALNRELSLADAAATLLAPDLRGHMDEFVRDMAISHAGWIDWWEFLWTVGAAEDIGCEHLETIEHGDSRYTLVGRWTGRKKGEHQVSAPVEATYLMRDGLVSEVTTSRTNYTFFMPLMRTRLGAALTLMRFAAWRRWRRA